MPKRLWSLIRKEFLQFFRDPALFFIVLWGFTGIIYLDTSATDLEMKRIALAVYDLDRTRASRELIDRFRMPYFRMIGAVQREEEIRRLLDSGKAFLILVIPQGFSRRLAEGSEAKVQLLIDGTISNGALVAMGYADQILEQYKGEIRPEVRALRRPGVEVKTRIRFNQNLQTEYFMSLTELFTVITMIAILLPAAAMVREKEHGTVEQLLVTPLRPWEIMLAKILPMGAIVLTGTFLGLTLVVQGIFHVPLRGNLFLFFVVTAIYVFTTSGLGLSIAALSRTLAEAILMTLLILAPMLFLSGTWTPLEVMPSWMRVITLFSPLRYYLKLGFGILLKGADLGMLWHDLLGLALLGGLLFALGALRFRRSFT
ncbi:MAG: ABC transporter permease [candidate division NC10 bacterium]|nr:ABC transporter permease [candidate division NC10 bacterium]